MEPDAAALEYDCDRPHLGAKLEKKEVFELQAGDVVAEEKVDALVLELEAAAFLDEVVGISSIMAWACRCLPNRFDGFFFLVTSEILQERRREQVTPQ